VEKGPFRSGFFAADLHVIDPKGPTQAIFFVKAAESRRALPFSERAPNPSATQGIA
jgi:hypothetical protein